MTWWHYLLLSNLYLTLFYGFYALLLRRETFFQLNRLYLVGSVLLSFVIPFAQSAWVKQWFITQQVQHTIYNAGPVVVYNIIPEEHLQITVGEAIASAYLLGVVILSVRFLWQLLLLTSFMKSRKEGGAWSFFKRIVVDEQLDNHVVIAAHEAAHARQWHSADVLLLEVIMILNWFNPVVYLYRRSVKQIHEFIADQDALKAGASKADYALLLLTQTFQAPVNSLLNPFFNHSILKQRILMLQKNRSQRIALVKYGFSAPLFVLMLVLSSATVNESRVVKGIRESAQELFVEPANPKQLFTARKDDAVPEQIIARKKKDALKVGIKDPVSKSGKVDLAPVPKDVSATLDDEPKPVEATVYNTVDEYPRYNGGIRKFYEYLSSNIRYPAESKENKVQGRAIITFIVEADGAITNIKALRSPDPSLGEEAVRVISASPKWIAGTKDGKAVRVQYTVPVQFSLPGLQKQDTVKRTADSRVGEVMPKGKKKPLYYVDGKLSTAADIKDISTDKIASMEVIKDKPATDVYGEKASGGVIKLKLKH